MSTFYLKVQESNILPQISTLALQHSIWIIKYMYYRRVIYMYMQWWSPKLRLIIQYIQYLHNDIMFNLSGLFSMFLFASNAFCD